MVEEVDRLASSKSENWATLGSGEAGSIKRAAKRYAQEGNKPASKVESQHRKESGDRSE
jgi:hypothetical protein